MSTRGDSCTAPSAAQRSQAVRLLAATAALALVTLSLGPAIAAVSRAGAAPIVTRGAMPRHVRLRGILVALHPNRRTGDLVLPNGNVLPLRFANAAQERRLHVGDSLSISADAHGHSRLLVRAVRVLALGSHWVGSHWSGSHWVGSHWSGSHWSGSHWVGSHWTMHGVVSRTMTRGTAELLGVNGAAVVVRVAGAPVAGAQSTAGLLAPSMAYADTVTTVAPGEAITVRVALTRAGIVAAQAVTIVATHVSHLDLEGTITAVNHAAGTVTLTDENGLSTVIAVGAQATSYRAGQSIEVAGAPGTTTSGVATVQAQSVETEVVTAPSSRAPIQPAPVATPTDTPLSTTDTNGQDMPTAVSTTAPDTAQADATATVTPMNVTNPDSQTTAPAIGTPAPLSTPSYQATPVATASAVATPGTPVATNTPAHVPAYATATTTPMRTATATPSRTATATVAPTNTPTAMNTATNTPTAMPTNTPTSTDTATPTPTATNTPTATATATNTPTATPTPTNTATPTNTPSPYLSQGSFVVGDVSVGTAGATAPLTWWSNQWATQNSLSGGSAPHSFKGYADVTSTNPPTCGGTFTATVGSSAQPPSSVPSQMAVIVASRITSSGGSATGGNTISGDVDEIVLINTNSGYAPDSGHTGTGTLVKVLCHG